MKEKIKSLKNEIELELNSVKNLKDLNEIKNKYLSKKLIKQYKYIWFDKLKIKCIMCYMQLHIGQMKITGKWQMPAEGIMLSGISIF